MSLGKGRAEHLQNCIVRSIIRAYGKLDWYVWRAVFSELLQDETVKAVLRKEGITIEEADYRKEN